VVISRAFLCSAREEFARDVRPLRFERCSRGRLCPTRAGIPIPRIPNVAFLAVQIRMHPRTVATVVFLRAIVSRVPVPARIVPKRLHGETAARRRSGIVSDRVLQLLE
jgi:hypothetical protein